jgi:hypothetical protein
MASPAPILRVLSEQATNFPVGTHLNHVLELIEESPHTAMSVMGDLEKQGDET